jgi:MtaA/CmuA family methyltransferase
MTGLERVQAALNGSGSDRHPVLPILHSGLPFMFDMPLGEFFTQSKSMADITIKGYRTFGYDGVQLSLGVTGEAQALGAAVEQPHDAGPILREFLLEMFFKESPDVQGALDSLRKVNPVQSGRMPLYYEAVSRTVDANGKEGFVLSLLRGPLLAASQLCGVETLLIAMIECPERVEVILDFTTDLAIHLAGWLVHSGAHGLMLGEATCSPNFISPRMYRTLVLPRHKKLVQACRDQGWHVIGLHICGHITPILSDIIDTGVDLVDIDYQVPAVEAISLGANRVTLRGNLDPSSVFRFGTPSSMAAATQSLLHDVKDCPKWIISSGCDIPPGTTAQNLHVFVKAAIKSLS